ncbi:hypothetical protein LCM17_23130 [Cereibacter sphaeroides]|nr:hypothetical protein [Cereibacter sphaeroides]
MESVIETADQVASSWWWHDGAATWLAAIAALLGAVASFYAVVLLRKTLQVSTDTLLEASKATQAAIEGIAVSREIGTAQTMAYISVSVEASFQKLEADSDHRVQITLKNAGVSPALDVTYATVLFVAPGAFPPDLLDGAMPEGAGQQSTIIPAGDQTISFGAIFLAEEVLNGILRRQASLYVACRFQYRDVFRRLHEGAFAAELCPTGDDPRAAPWGFATVPGMNRARYNCDPAS